MNCRSCGTEIPEGSKFCLSCGATQTEPTATDPPHYSYQRADATPPLPSRPLPNATGQIVFAVINIVCFWGALFGIAALVFAILASGAKTFEDAKSKLKTAKICIPDTDRLRARP